MNRNKQKKSRTSLINNKIKFMSVKTKTVQKTIVGMICGLALLLSSCEKDLPPPSGGEEVTINFSLESFTFGESETVTRGSGEMEPETVTIPVGDGGLYIVATLLPDPAVSTRGAINITTGTEVRIVAYTTYPTAIAGQATYTVSGTALTSGSPLSLTTGNSYTFAAYACNNQKTLPTSISNFNPATADVLWGKTDPIAVTAGLGNVTIQIRHLCSQVTTVLKNNQNHLFGGTINVSIPGNNVNLTSGEPVATTTAASYSFPNTWASSGSPSGSIRTSNPILVFTNSAATTTVNIASGMTINGTSIGAQTVPFNQAMEPYKSYTLTVEFKRLNPNGRVTAYTNVMYDFQHQTLEAYVTSGAAPVGWQWQVSTSRNGSYVNIPGAVSATYTVPANFIHNYSTLAPGITGTPEKDELFFKCVLTDAIGSAAITDANALGIEFVRTTDGSGTPLAGYGGLGTDNPYLTINRARHNGTGSNTINIALLNVGATPADGIGLGDFYQWGRVADGHQRTVWSKQNRSATAINDAGAPSPNPIYAFMINWLGLRSGWGTPSTTSDTVARSVALQVYNPNGNGQIDPSNTGFYGNFITTTSVTSDWGQGNTPSNNRWGATTTNATRANAPVSISDWAFQGNSPCPAGWRVPSWFEQWDIYRGNGTDEPDTVDDSGAYNEIHPDNQNTWRWRSAQNNAYGGVIITNSTGGKLFLPAAGYRNFTNGTLNNIIGNTVGYYWSSTYNSSTIAWGLEFSNSRVAAGRYGGPRAYGFTVRCVKE